MKVQPELTAVNFAGQVFYVGLDVHKKQWSVTIQNNGRVIKRFSMDPNPKVLARYLKRNYPSGQYMSVYEAGFSGYWAHRQLQQYKVDNIIVNPADIPTSQKERKNRNDKVDSRKLARELQNCSLTGIYIPTIEEQSYRSLSRRWRSVTRKQTAIKNQIISFLDYYGLAEPQLKVARWSRRFIAAISQIEYPTPIAGKCMEGYLAELHYYRNERRELLSQMRHLRSQEPIIRLIGTVPGIGLITSVILYAEINRIERFSNPDKLTSYIGLIPSVSSSDEREWVRGITSRDHKSLRPMLIESAWKAITCDPALLMVFNEYAVRMRKQKAIIRVAKKLTKRLYYVWKNGTPYVMGVIQ